MVIDITGKKKEVNAAQLFSEDMNRVSDLSRLNANMQRYTSKGKKLEVMQAKK